MADRFYTIEKNPQGETTFVIYDFESREVRRTAENPHPEEGARSASAPFFTDGETFWAVVHRIAEWDEMSKQHAKRPSF